MPSSIIACPETGCGSPTSGAGSATTEPCRPHSSGAIPQAVPHLLDVPRYLWREALVDVGSLAGALVTLNAPRATAAVMRLGWFLRYVRERWRTRWPRLAEQPAVSRQI
jgi:hypothetical protein